MAFFVPTFRQIRNRILADIDGALGASGRTMGPIEYAIGTAAAGASFLLHQAIARAARNKVPSTAESSVMRRWAAFFSVTPKSATYNTGTATFAASTGTSIAAGSTLRLRDGTEYTTDALASEAAGTITVAFTARTVGAAGTATTGTAIFLGSPVSGVNSQGAVASPGISGGTDAESDPDVLDRLLYRLQHSPKGGTDSDWIVWTKATPGVDVQNAWVFPNTLGWSSVRVLFTVPGDNPIPTGGQATTVTAYLATKAPIDMVTYAAQPPTAQPVNYVLTITPDTPTIRANVEAALRALHADEAEPGGTLLLSHIREAISGATGETDHVLVSPAANITATSAYHLPTFGTIDFEP